jgi:Leucine-rich repeat (LRR) protein
MVSKSVFGALDEICDGKMKYLNVQESSFKGNYISVIKCEELTHLIIESSNLEKVEVGNQKNLINFSLRNNRIKEIPENFFDLMEKLENVQMPYNKIESLSGKIFKNNLNLTIVNFSFNPIIKIDPNIFKNNLELFEAKFESSNCLNFIAKNQALAKIVDSIKKSSCKF